MIEIVHAGLGDLDGIAAIYNDAVLKTVASFDTEPRTPEKQLEWFQGHDSAHPVIVARDSASGVVGWASLNVFHPRPAYARTAEDSVYVAAEWRGRGIGSQLLARLIELAAEAGHHCLVARIADHNPVSIGLHEALGFRVCGELREVGRKFDRWIDVTHMQLLLPPR